jgi:hypothetical protein
MLKLLYAGLAHGESVGMQQSLQGLMNAYSDICGRLSYYCWHHEMQTDKNGYSSCVSRLSRLILPACNR